jgi:hypothetical protein
MGGRDSLTGMEWAVAMGTLVVPGKLMYQRQTAHEAVD